MTYSEFQAAILRLNSHQLKRVTDQVISCLRLNGELESTRPDCCPVCNDVSGRFIKKGFLNGKQRYQCKTCGHRFTYNTKLITSNSHQPVESWITLIEDTFSLKSLDKIAENIDVCRDTAFHMRHKLLSYLETMMNGNTQFESLIDPMGQDST